MRRDELEELHYITPLENLPSIMKHGILSHRQAEKISHKSVAMTEIQKRRAATPWWASRADASCCVI